MKWIHCYLFILDSYEGLSLQSVYGNQIGSFLFCICTAFNVQVSPPSPAASLNKLCLCGPCVNIPSDSSLWGWRIGQGEASWGSPCKHCKTSVKRRGFPTALATPFFFFLSSPQEGFVLWPLIFWNVKLGLFQRDKVYWESQSWSALDSMWQSHTLHSKWGTEKRNWVLPCFS